MVLCAISRLTSFALVNTDHHPGFLIPKHSVSVGGRLRVGDFLPSLLQKVVRVCRQIRDRRTLASVLPVRILSLRTENVAEVLEALDRVVRPILVLRRAGLEDTERVIRFMGPAAWPRARQDDCAFFRLALQSGNDSLGDAARHLLAHPRRRGRQEGPGRHRRRTHLLRHGCRIAASDHGLQPVRLHAHAVPQRAALQPGFIVPGGSDKPSDTFAAMQSACSASARAITSSGRKRSRRSRSSFSPEIFKPICRSPPYRQMFSICSPQRASGK